MRSFSLTAASAQLERAISSRASPISLSLFLSVVLEHGGMLSVDNKLDNFLSPIPLCNIPESKTK